MLVAGEFAGRRSFLPVRDQTLSNIHSTGRPKLVHTLFPVVAPPAVYSDRCHCIGDETFPKNTPECRGDCLTVQLLRLSHGDSRVWCRSGWGFLIETLQTGEMHGRTFQRR